MEKIATHITREWLLDQRIAVYNVNAIDVQALNDWSKAVVATLTDWQTDHHLMLFDLSTGVSIPLLVLTNFHILDPGLTKGGQAQVDEILTQKPTLNIKLAVVLPLTTSGRIASTRGRSSADKSRIESVLFYNRTAALKWLTAFIPGDASK